MKKLIVFYKRLSFFQGVAVTLSLSSIVALAANNIDLIVFSPGTTISSSQINSNFDKLANLVQGTQSQVYAGTWDATTAPPNAITPGEYYIVTVAGTAGGVSFVIGDWAIWNGLTFDKLSPSGVTSIFGRAGAVIPLEGDYNLNLLSDVDLTTVPNDQDFLRYDAATQKWKAAVIPTPSITETDPTVMNFAKTALPACSAGQASKTDGASFSCITIPTPFTGAANKMVATDGTGNLYTTALDGSILSYLSGATSNIQTQIDAKLSSFGGTISSGTLAITGAGNLTVPNPISTSDAVNKGYVDSFGQWLKSGPDVYLSSGNVGIGTSTPTQTLHVLGSSLFDGNAMVNGNLDAMKFVSTNSGSGSTPAFSSTSSSTTGIFFPPSNMIGFSTGAVERMRIDSNGKVGIGTTTPSAILDISSTTNDSAIIVPRATTANRPTGTDGMIRYNTTTLLMEFYQNGSWVNFTTISDGRLKTNLKPVEHGLATVNKLQPVFFDWDQTSARAKSFGSKHQIGFIAQQVEKVLPEVVEIGKDSFRSIEYGKMVSVVVASIQELSKKFDSRDREIINLKEENRMIKNYICTRDPKADFCN